MATYTPNYNFPMYEGTDAPNLLDQYNSAVGLIDTQIKQGADAQANTQTAVANLSAQVSAFDQRITTAQNTASGAATAASQAQEAAASAQSAATSAGSAAASAQQTASAAQTAANGKAPMNHASPTSAYGLADGTNYGHVKTMADLSGAVDDTTVPTSKAVMAALQAAATGETVHLDAPAGWTEYYRTAVIHYPNLGNWFKVFGTWTNSNPSSLTNQKIFNLSDIGIADFPEANLQLANTASFWNRNAQSSSLGSLIVQTNGDVVLSCTNVTDINFTQLIIDPTTW